MPIRNLLSKAIVLCVFVLQVVSVHGSSHHYVKRIDYSHGLSENTISSFAQDRQGYIWIGTREGLNRYDGYSCKSYFSSVLDKHSLRSSKIEKIFIDSKYDLWVCHNKGTDRYVKEKDAFEELIINTDKGAVKTIFDVAEQSGIKWVLSQSQGLIGIELSSNKLVYQSDVSQGYHFMCPKSEQEMYVGGGYQIHAFNTSQNSFVEHLNLKVDAPITGFCKYAGCLWINTNNGLLLYDEQQKVLLTLESYAQSLARGDISLLPLLQDIKITAMQVLNDELWISTDGNGIIIIKAGQVFEARHLKDMGINRGLSTNAIRCLFTDKHHNMWIGMVHNGVNLICSGQKKFYHLVSAASEKGFNGNFSGFVEDKNNTLWAASFDGLFQIDQTSMTLSNQLAKGAVINAITLDWKGNIYMGTYNRGLLKYDNSTQAITGISTQLLQPEKTSVNELLTDSKGNIWIGTSSRLYVLQADEANALQDHWPQIRGVTALLEDKKGNIWAGTVNGLYSINIKTGQLDVYTASGQDPFRINSDWINCLFEDPKGNIWVGTNGGGVNCIRSGNNEVYYYKNSADLKSNIVYGIARDHSGLMWFTSSNGIVRLNPEDGSMDVYDYSDGISNTQYITRSLFLSHTGRMFCGGEKGIDYFFPNEIKDHIDPPEVIVNGFYLDNKLLDSKAGNAAPEKQISAGDSLILPYDQSYFNFQFTGIEYANPQKIQYAYQLEGFNNQWTYTKEPGIVNYGHIPPGRYAFKVKAANSDGYWTTEPAIVKVIVNPPFRQTPLAYALWFLGISGVLYLTYRYLLERKLLQTRLQNEQNERQRVEELNQLKLRLFTHISHEFRTPLSLIISPVQELLKRFVPNDQSHKDLTLIHENARKLQVLVNQVLEVRKVESGRIQMQKEQIELVAFVRCSCEAFQHWANQKNIHLSFSSMLNELSLHLDQSLMEKVIYNLLSNAIKFTGEGGTIRLELAMVNNQCQLTVTDSGIGIAPANQPRLFDMFYQVKATNRDQETGSGVGLALCKELIELHNGHIRVDSEPGKGSCFTVSIPVPEQAHTSITSPDAIEEGTEQSPGIAYTDHVKLLLVDDNEELRHFLVDKLSHRYQLWQAGNGVEALEMALEKQPQLIISDVMMPLMDGWEFCAKIKSDIRTSHIPVILLSALGDDENTIKGLDLGADAYVSKPFNLDHIHSLIQSLLRNRQAIKKRLGLEAGIGESIEESGLTQVDKMFLNEVQKCITQNMSAPDFSVQVLSDLVGMSRVNLHAKLKALADISPSDLIIQTRLKEAIQLLRQREKRMSEIADLTGFSTASHFSRTFKKYYGASPSEFINGNI
ncbi:MAG: response regulator [Marinilabiliaceae bacterium]|nr:response regulator [Marinilabiliaceae bacterium]